MLKNTDYAQTSRYYGIKESNDVVQTDLIVLNLPYQVTYVRESEVNRPELLAQRVYNNPMYWWVLCQFNGIQNPNLLPLGFEIRCPNLTETPRGGI